MNQQVPDVQAAFRKGRGARDQMANIRWMKYDLESRLLGEISITSDMQMTPPLWEKVKKN